MTTHIENVFSKAYVLGGSPCSGKSTIAEMLVAEFGFQYYRADDHDPDHMHGRIPNYNPSLISLPI